MRPLFAGPPGSRGRPWWGMQGGHHPRRARPEARLVGNYRKEHESEPRTTCRMPPHQSVGKRYEASGVD